MRNSSGIEYAVTIYPGGAWSVEKVMTCGDRRSGQSLGNGVASTVESAECDAERLIQADKNERRLEKERAALVKRYTVLG